MNSCAVVSSVMRILGGAIIIGRWLGKSAAVGGQQRAGELIVRQVIGLSADQPLMKLVRAGG